MCNVGPFLQGPLRLALNMRGLRRLWLAHSKAVHVNIRCCLLLPATCTVLQECFNCMWCFVPVANRSGGGLACTIDLVLCGRAPQQPEFPAWPHRLGNLPEPCILSGVRAVGYLPWASHDGCLDILDTSHSWRAGLDWPAPTDPYAGIL